MIQAAVKWTGEFQFAGSAGSSHALVIDGDSKVANSPMELVLLALCGCTGYDVTNILQKKREPVVAVEVSAQAEKALESPRVFTHIKLLYYIKGNVTRKAVEDAVRLSREKYCSVSAMLEKTARITHEIRLDSH
jgi:putative redox protein